MTKTILPVAFFFGANNKAGYCSLYSDIYNPFEKGKHIILKGGPGTGKSTLMKKIANKLEKEGYFVERGYCSADPNSLDVVVAPEINFSILDGTAPHTIDPTVPGVSEFIVDLSTAWDKSYLNTHADEIFDLLKSNGVSHKKAASFLSVAGQIETDIVLLCNNLIDKAKAERFAKRLCSRNIPKKSSKKQGVARKRFLSAITPDGVITQHDSVVALSEKIITFNDEFSLVTPAIMDYIADYAVNAGYDIYKCYCPLFPRFKIEHIIIPELKLTFFTENSYHHSIDGVTTRINASRFYDKEAFKLNKEKLNFQKKAKKELIDEAVRNLNIALKIHDRLEEYYIKATDFSVVEEMAERVLTKQVDR